MGSVIPAPSAVSMEKSNESTTTTRTHFRITHCSGRRGYRTGDGLVFPQTVLYPVDLTTGGKGCDNAILNT